VLADRTAYDVVGLYWQTMKPVLVTSLGRAGAHDPIQWVEFINVAKLYILKRDH